MALTLVTSDLIVGLDYSKLSGTVTTWNQNTTGSAATLTTARNIGGVSFNGSVAINLPGVNTAGNQNTSGTAAGLSATLVVGSGGTGVTSITALKNVLDDETWTFANAATFSGGGVFSNSSQGKVKLIAGSDEYSSLEFANASGTTQWEISKNNTHDLYFYKGGHKMMLKSGGNVGIGTTSPSARLTVKDSVDNTFDSGIAIIRSASSQTGYINMKGGAMNFNSPSIPIVFRQAGSAKLSISSGGDATFSGTATFTKDQNADTSIKLFNPNTGTSTEATIYVTNSSANANGLFLGTTGVNTTTAGGFVQDGSHIGSGSGASGGLSIMTRAAADIRFYTNGHTNERMRITSGGNVDFKSHISINSASGAAGAQGGITINQSPQNSASRNWKIWSDDAAWGDFNIKVATAYNGSTYTTPLNISSGGVVRITKDQVTTNFDSTSFLRLHPSDTTDSGGYTNMIFGTSTVNNYGVAIGGLRSGADGTPSFSIRMLNDSITGTEVMNISSGGNATFKGDIIFSTAGKGICLGVTSNTDANTLDDYEEGTWDPLPYYQNANDQGKALVGQVNASQTAGFYTKIGNMVHVHGIIVWNLNEGNVNDIAVDNVGVKTLPFVSANETNNFSAITFAINGANTVPSGGFDGELSKNSIILLISSPSQSGNQGRNLGTGDVTVKFSCSYRAVT